MPTTRARKRTHEELVSVDARFALDGGSCPDTNLTTARSTLIGYLHTAAYLEHTLLNAYITAAYSLKSLPEEFAYHSDGVTPNLRQAIQFERFRYWKESISNVAAEEMVHLHYVQSMLHALGEPAHFHLPARDPVSNEWIFEQWTIDDNAPGFKTGVQVALQPLTLDNIKRFILYESTDMLQDGGNIFQNSTITQLFGAIGAFEEEMWVATGLYGMSDANRTAIAAKIKALFGDLVQQSRARTQTIAFVGQVKVVDPLPFQSIRDFYLANVLPCYKLAFDQNWVPYNNSYLYNEMNSGRSQEGFIPLHALPRSTTSNQFAAGNYQPIVEYVNIEDIVSEIIFEGEGSNVDFVDTTQQMFTNVSTNGGFEAYLDILSGLSNDIGNGVLQPEWWSNSQALRLSHLYRFATIYAQMQEEITIDANFKAYRTVGTGSSNTITPLTCPGSSPTATLECLIPNNFNAVYLVLTQWLTRIYEPIPNAADYNRRGAISMIATWPLMSLGIRTFLELVACYDIPTSQLFLLNSTGLNSPSAVQLLVLFQAPDRSQVILEQMDDLALQVLAEVADWATQLFQAKSAPFTQQMGQPYGAPPTKLVTPAQSVQYIIMARLLTLQRLSEFRTQFGFRVHGGYSNTGADVNYVTTVADTQYDHEEDPTVAGPSVNLPQHTFYNSTLVMRIQFSGWSRAQMGTDPDPSLEEVGSKGTLMVHTSDSADGVSRWFDRSLLWQPGLKAIPRPPADKLPQLGVQARRISLMVPGNDGASGELQNLGDVNSVGAVQTSGQQSAGVAIGFNEVASFDPDTLVPGQSLLLDLLPNGTQNSYFSGSNHLIWRDGEPIDPFRLAFSLGSNATGAAPATPLFGRDIWSKDKKPYTAMNGMQRINTNRYGLGFDSNLGGIPEWARFAELNEMLADPNVPPFVPYLNQRADVLADQLVSEVNAIAQSIATAAKNKDKEKEKVSVELGVTGDATPTIAAAALAATQAQVTSIASLLDRRARVAVPEGTTQGWLTVMLTLAHSISGVQSDSASQQLLAPLGTRLGVGLTLPVANPDRTATNARWLANYRYGLMDTDALAAWVWGEVFVPVTVTPATGNGAVLSYQWNWPGDVTSVVGPILTTFFPAVWSTGTCTQQIGVTTTRLCPFNQYVIGEVFSRQVPGVSLVTTLQSMTPASATSWLSTLACAVLPSGGGTECTWRMQFVASGYQNTVDAFRLVALMRQQITAALNTALAPQTSS